TGGPEEKHMLMLMRDRINSRHNLEVMEEELSLRDFTAVLAGASVVVSGSTGPMHLAAAAGTKTLSFFPPDTITPMRAQRWMPLGNRSVILKPKYGIEDEKEKAMDSIDLEMIVENIEELAG
ncbi:MAG: hypothetical protein LLG37_01700, partial [Spirochaetia bacterium]|nr:hypothetical protein [Spirochaetia bacterium]